MQFPGFLVYCGRTERQVAMKSYLKHLPLGLRVVKTALAVTLSILIVRLVIQDNLSVFYAAFGALIGMDTTLSKSLKQGLTQLIGVLLGTIIGYVSMLIYPDLPPAVIVGLGVLILLTLTNAMKLAFTASLACIIYLSACLTPSDNILRDSIYRLLDTSIGLTIALAVNSLIRPYNNKKRILYLLRQLRRQIPEDLESIVVEERYPDLQICVELLRKVDRELSLYHSQHFFHRNQDSEALLRGCAQLAQRMVQELEVIRGMDSLGDLGTENAAVMRELGMNIPEAGAASRKCTRQDTIVMNYHLDKLLTAYRFLGELMEL